MIMKIEITIEGYNIGISLADENGKQLKYEGLIREDQIKVLNSFVQGYEFFERFLKEE